LQQRFGITTVYVTHDQEEALTLSSRIAVFNKGVVEQVGTPDEVYNQSHTEFVCNFIGDINFLENEFLLSAGANRRPGIDLAKKSYIRLERMHVNSAPDDTALKARAVVRSSDYFGLYIKYTLDAGGQAIKVIEKNDGKPFYESGSAVTLTFRPENIMQYGGG